MHLNKLTRLDSYIFQVMLERMVLNRGYLTLALSILTLQYFPTETKLIESFQYSA